MFEYKNDDKKTTEDNFEESIVGKLDDNNNIDLRKSNITFKDIDHNNGLIEVYLVHKKDEEDEFKKVEIKNGKKNFHIIKLRDFRINDFSQLEFKIVDNISLAIKLEIKKAFGFGHTKGKSFHNRLSIFNANKKMEQILNKGAAKISSKKIDNTTQKKVDTQNGKNKKDENNKDKNNSIIEQGNNVNKKEAKRK